MNDAEFAEIAVRFFQMFQMVVPIDTGNMRYNATQFNTGGMGQYEIIVNGDIAPYAVYTNEPWTSPKWNGKQNPNEGWIDDTVETIAEFLAFTLGGELIKE